MSPSRKCPSILAGSGGRFAKPDLKLAAAVRLIGIGDYAQSALHAHGLTAENSL